MTKSLQVRDLAKEIITRNQYMTLATLCKNKYKTRIQYQPWTSPVAYAYDSDLSLYFISLPYSIHSKNISSRSTVSIAIFDSHQYFGQGVGIQALVQVKIIKGIREYTHALNTYINRDWPYGEINLIKQTSRYIKKFDYRFYKLTFKKIWINNPKKEYDERVLVDWEVA